MCSPLRFRREINVARIISQNLGEKKLLDEWVLLVNSNLPVNRTITRFTFAHSVWSFAKEGNFIVVRERLGQRNIFYEFKKREEINNEGDKDMRTVVAPTCTTG